MTKKIAIDLFSGTGSATKAFQESEDWEVFRVEINEDQEAKLHADILDLEPGDLPNPDFVWASPPCTVFSKMSMRRYWTNDGVPKEKKAVDGLRIVYHTLWLIQELDPNYWFMENPMAKLRMVLPLEPEGTVTYCQYGEDMMKPTDLWGEHPKSFEYRSCSPGSDCHLGQEHGKGDNVNLGKDKEERSRVPYGLSKSILEAVENPGKKKSQSKLNALM